MDPLELRYWHIGQITDFVKETIQSVGGDGWNLLVPRLQKALIEEKVLKIVFLQVTMPSKAEVIELREAMLIEAGLEAYVNR